MVRRTWDPEKEAANRTKHGLPLEAAVSVLNDDPLAASRIDPHPDEERYNTVGSADEAVTLFVVHTYSVADDGDEGELVGRIIPVRNATRSERKAYEEGEF